MKLAVGSLIYTGFLEAQVRSSMDTLFDEFRFISLNRWGEGSKGIRLGDSCKVLTPDDEPLLIGYANGLGVPIGGDLTISGHDKTYDLIGATIDGTGEFKGLTVQQIVASICAPFGISVSGIASQKIDVYRYGLNDSAADVLLDICSRHGLICNADGGGNLIIEQIPTRTRASLRLIEGQNIQTGSLMLGEVRASDVAFRGQTAALNAIGTATGSASRHRPKAIVQSGAITSGQAITGAGWAASIARADAYRITVSGLYNERPNRLINVESPTLGVSGDLLIRSILWSMTKAGGHQTVFDLINPAAYGGEETKNDWIA